MGNELGVRDKHSDKVLHYSYEVLCHYSTERAGISTDRYQSTVPQLKSTLSPWGMSVWSVELDVLRVECCGAYVCNGIHTTLLSGRRRIAPALHPKPW